MTRKIIKNREIINDSWQTLADNDAIPSAQNIIVSHARWQQQRDELISDNNKLGIIIDNEKSLDAIKDHLSDFDLIAIVFPAFKDGRGYSYARLLRERYQFKGEVRAVGNILRDQIYYLSRCGFDAFALDEGGDIKDALNAFNDFTVNYQPAYNSPVS